MSDKSGSVGFLYGNCVGRFLLKTIMKLHLDRIAVAFLRSRLSKCLVKGYIKRNNIDVTPEEAASFRSYREMFVRTRTPLEFDSDPDHLISPCDSLLSAFPIDENSSFAIKNSIYRVSDFLKDEELAKNYLGGTALVFRLCASDYHHYCYIDNGYQGKNHPIPGILHSVQPIACETYPVFVLNKRCWCLMETEHFGPVVQCEIGALVVGGIENEKENSSFIKGEEKGHFELAGSTIVLLFESGRIRLNSKMIQKLTQSEEVRIVQGEWIGVSSKANNE